MGALSLVWLGERARHKPNRLPRGQQQGVAVDGALVTAPALLLADEPTGDLDSRSTEEVL
ncbi:ABC transporter, partial [Streptomyces rubellomurinus subsp. indigoferus]